MPQDLLRLLKDVHHDSHLIQFIANDLKTGRLSLFKDFPEMQSSVLRKLSFKDVPPELYTPALHQEFLQAISSDTEELILHDNLLLTDKELVLLIERLPKLKKIELAGCPQLRGDQVILPDGFFTKRIVESFVKALEKREMASINIKNCVNLQESLLVYLANLATGPFQANITLDEKFLPLIVAEVERTPSKFVQASKVLKTDDDLKALVNAFAFGSDKWQKYFGNIDEAIPALPNNIVEILCSADPYNKDKKMAETRMLVLVPRTVNGKPLTLKSFRELVKAPRDGHKTDYEYFWGPLEKEHFATQPGRAQWVLMTKDVIPGSRGLSYEKQKEMVELMPQHEVPDLLSATVAILTHYVRTGERLYSNAPMTYTRCKETAGGYQTVVGGFASAGLSLHNNYVNDNYGVAALRKFL